MQEILRSIFDMLPDVAGILLAALSLSLIFLPKELKMLEADKWKWLRWSLAAIFAVAGIGGVASNVIQKANDKTERDKLNHQVSQLKDELDEVRRKVNENTNASVAITALVPRNGVQEVSSEQKMQFNIAYFVKQNTAKNMRQVTLLRVENVPPNPVYDKKVWADFKGFSAQAIGEKGQDRVADTYDWKTLEIKLSRNEAAGLMAGTKTLYVLGLVEWNNLSGTDGHFDACLSLQKPETKILTPQTASWHICLF